jgi:signal transduction histidine kinase
MFGARSIYTRLVALIAALVALACGSSSEPDGSGEASSFQYPETRELVDLVNQAAVLIRSEGEAAFDVFRVEGSRWRQGEEYVFVLDPEGKMVVHPDPAMEGSSQLSLKDVNGKPVVRGLLDAAMSLPAKAEGWYHYQWPVPGGLLPRWKSSFVKLVEAPSGRRYVVGSGSYNDRMERAFVVDLVSDAVGQVERLGTAAFPRFRDPKGPFVVKDAYVFVFDRKGTDLVNPGFPNLEGRELLDLQDSDGKPVIREMFEVVERAGEGWVDYMWPKPGESRSTLKSAYVAKARMGDDWVLVGSGVYLADAPKAAPSAPKMKAAELVSLVRDAAVVFEQRGEAAYDEFRTPGSRWLHDDVYFFVWTLEGTRVFHAASPEIEGRLALDEQDVLGRPYARMFLETARSASGEGWVHYVYPEPGKMFPVWKSAFLKRVEFPSGGQHLIGCGIYDMQMDDTFIEDVVSRAAALVEEQGRQAFPALRDRKGPFVFMDTYVFVEATDGTELVNGGQPSLEGRNLIDLEDVRGVPVVRDQIAFALKEGSGWVSLHWYKPGQNVPALKKTFVRRVESGGETFIVGSGFYPEE